MLHKINFAQNYYKKERTWDFKYLLVYSEIYYTEWGNNYYHLKYFRIYKIQRKICVTIIV